MRVLALTNLYPPHYLGGYELLCRDTMVRFQAHGHQVSVLTSRVRIDGVDEADEAEEQVWRELQLYWDDHELLNPSLFQRARIERANQRALSAALEASRPDVVSVWNMGALSLGLLTTVVDRRLPIVFCVCDDWLLYGPDLDAWARVFLGRPRLAALTRRLVGVPTAVADLGGAGAFCFISCLTRRRAEERSRWRPGRATVVYSGFDAADFPVLAEPRRRPWSWRLLYVGRVDERKGIETAVRALAELPDSATLDVVGRGDRREASRLERLATELGLAERVRFSAVRRSALAARYRQADALVFPSIWEEPFGVVPLEAMACGTPVVATGAGGSGEFLWDGVNCVRFPAGDEKALAAAIDRLAEDAGLRHRLVEAGLATAAQLTVDGMAAALEDWHFAAAGGFAEALPDDRPLLVPSAPRE